MVGSLPFADWIRVFLKVRPWLAVLHSRMGPREVTPKPETKKPGTVAGFFVDT
jgi:hypothetical protein